jgi:hypothetical protein
MAQKAWYGLQLILICFWQVTGRVGGAATHAAYIEGFNGGLRASAVKEIVEL